MSEFAARAKAIVAALRTGEPDSVEMFEAFGQLDALPAEAVRAAFAAWSPLPDLDNLDTATRLAHGLPLRPLRLRTVGVEKDADVLDLGPVAEDQVRLAGLSWDGRDLAAEERLDGELEGSFAGTLERRVLADAESPTATPLFDVVLFAEDAGVVFAAGTSRIVAMIAYGKVEMRDRRTRVAIEATLAGPTTKVEDVAPREAPAAPMTAPTATPPTRAKLATAVKPAVAKKPAPALTRSEVAAQPAKVAKKKAATAKAPLPKKAAAKPASAKKPVAKASAKKPAVKKVVAKAGAKKASAKKVTKKPAAKAAKKVVTKKTSAKKSAAKAPKKKSARR